MIAKLLPGYFQRGINLVYRHKFLKKRRLHSEQTPQEMTFSIVQIRAEDARGIRLFLGTTFNKLD